MSYDGKSIRDYKLEQPTDEQLTDIYAEFNTTKESVKRDVAYLIEWLEQQPHLPSIKDETILTNFLIRCKNSLERVKARLDAFYTTKSLMPDIFSKRNFSSPELRKTCDYIGLVPLPKLTPKGQRIMIQTIKPLPEDFTANVELILKTYTALLELSLKIDTCREYVFINDLRNINVSLTPLFMRIFRTMAQLIQFVVWPKDKKDIIEVLPEECLPTEFGGKLSSMADLEGVIRKLFDDNVEWLMAAESEKADLDKLPPNSNFTKDDVLSGLDGSFRKLTLD